ncbi:unnamed protein product [Penicillium glandicola]
MTDLLRRRGEFIHRRTFPDLPPGHDDWETQKRLYCRFQLGTTRKTHTGTPRLQQRLRATEYGLVFCHRGYYERASQIVENSLAAITSGFAQKLFLHEVDCRFGGGSDSGQQQHQFLAHDLSPKRVTPWRLQEWSELAYEQIYETQLVSRRVDLDQLDFASTYLRAFEKVPRLREAMHKKHTIHYGLQIDLREDDFAKALVDFTTQYPKVRNHRARAFISESEYRSRNVILKGARQYCLAEYGRTFVPDQLYECPNLIMVFYSEPLVDLALQQKGMSLQASIQERWDGLSLEHLTEVARDQILSFVDIEISEGVYNFMLEIVYGGLGLGYHGYPPSSGQKKRRKGPANPLDGEPLMELEFKFESRVDRAMIDVALELRREYPGVVLSSCTRLPDVITPDGMKYGTRYGIGSLEPWPENESGLSRKLRALHGGLYPRSDLVVADDPAAEVAARTWIDQYSSLDRSELLEKPYYEWLQAEPEVHAAVRGLNDGEFLANKCEEYEIGENETERQERIESAMDRMYHGSPPVGDPEPLQNNWPAEVQAAEAVGEVATAIDQTGTGGAPPARTAAGGRTAEQNFQRMVEQFEAKEKRERAERARWSANAGKRDQTRLPPYSEVKRLHDKASRERADRESERELKLAKERRRRRFERARASEEVVGADEHQHGHGHGHDSESSDNLHDQPLESDHDQGNNYQVNNPQGNYHQSNDYQGNLDNRQGNTLQGYSSNIEMTAGTQSAGHGVDGRNDDNDSWCGCFCCGGS